jgi:hypothetical protein
MNKENFKITVLLIITVIFIALSGNFWVGQRFLDPTKSIEIHYYINQYTYETSDTFKTEVDTVAIDTTFNFTKHPAKLWYSQRRLMLEK